MMLRKFLRRCYARCRYRPPTPGALVDTLLAGGYIRVPAYRTHLVIREMEAREGTYCLWVHTLGGMTRMRMER